MLHVAFVNHSYAPCQSGKELLQILFSIPDWAKAIRQTGTKVTVIMRLHQDEQLTEDGVDYFFIKDGLRPNLRAYQSARKFHKKAVALIDQLDVDVVHLHNPLALGANFAMSRLLKNVPVLIQDHVGIQHLNRPRLLKRSLRFVDKVIFAAPGQELCWIEQGVLESERIDFVMENSSTFQKRDRALSRQSTGLRGEPVFLWVGNLNENKDPFTVLRAFQQILTEHPGSSLYMIYKETVLEGAIQLFLEDNEFLKERVVLIGPKDRASLEHYYNSADYFVLASHKEGSGYSAIEAISCGVIPILSDIPSFRQITNHGEIGGLFGVGKSEDLAQQALKLLEKPLEEERERTAHFFHEHLSFKTIAYQTLEIYQEIIRNRGLLSETATTT